MKLSSKNFLYTAAFLTIGAFSIGSVAVSNVAVAQDIEDTIAGAIEDTIDDIDLNSINAQIEEIQAAMSVSNSPEETAALQEDLDELEDQLPDTQYVYEGDKGAFSGATKPKRVFNNVGRHKYCNY